jgi:23S rRNA pseudouridine2605 synthase
MRIAKAIAHAGLCSRRDAEKWIEQGRVAVNGALLTTPAYVVKPGDEVSVDANCCLRPSRAAITSRRGSHQPCDPQGRKTVFEALPAELPRVVSVGRLTQQRRASAAHHRRRACEAWCQHRWLRRYRVRRTARRVDLDRPPRA